MVSVHAVTSSRSLAANRPEVTPSLWPVRVALGSPVAASQSCAVLSPKPVASTLPSGQNVVNETYYVCPVSVRVSAIGGTGASRTLTVPSLPALAIMRPWGVQPRTKSPDFSFPNYFVDRGGGSAILVVVRLDK